MNYPRFNELFWEFAEFIEDFHALFLDSIVGYELIHENLERHQSDLRKILGSHEYATKEFQDTCLIAYKDLGGQDHQLVSTSPLMKQGPLRSRIESDGKNTRTFGNMIIVSSYAYWEEYLRIEIGKAMGVLDSDATNTDATRAILNEEVKNDFWGDMRYLRNSIVHAHGIANSDVDKCKVIKWFKSGDRIILGYQEIRAIFLFLGVYRNEIHKMQFPPLTIRIPVN